MKLKLFAFLFASLVFCACMTAPASGQERRFAVSLVDGIEVYRNNNQNSRIFGNREFLTSPVLCAAWEQGKGQLAQALISASASVNPSLPSGVSIVRQSADLSGNCAAGANYAAGLININVNLPGNTFTFNVTTPGPLPQDWDPRVSVQFDAKLSTQIEIPTNPRTGLVMSPVQVSIFNIVPTGENLTGDIALAAAKIVSNITGQDFLGKLTQDRTFQFGGVNRYLGPINSELAAQLPAMEHVYEATTKLVILRGLSPEAALDSYASFRSSNYPDRYIRHRNSLGYIDSIRDSLGKLDATFRVVPGLAGRCVSFESYNYPGYFLRHQNSRLKLSPGTNDRLFQEDATFCKVQGLAGSGVSFQSANYQDFYIRHRNFELWLDRNDHSDLFTKDATFQQVSPLVLPPGPVR